ncbi:MAG: response regulator transcription factor, partial [Oscillochloris sp.]|nr:response regulator transcription factor [Oscillochloris sp.]
MCADTIHHRTRVVIADDHEMVRRGIAMTLEAESDLEVVGQAATGRAAVDLVAQLMPDVVLLDIQMPDMDGIATATAIRAGTPGVTILVLSSYSDDARVYAALRAGVNGYLLKELSADDLVAAVRGAARGEPQLHPKIARKLMDRMAPPDDPISQLSQREQEVLRLVAAGRSNKEIG